MVKRFIPSNTVYVRYLPKKGWSANLYSNEFRLPNKKIFATLQNLYNEFSELNPWHEPTDETCKELRLSFVEESGRPYDEVDINIHYKYKHRWIRIRMGWKHRFEPTVENLDGTSSFLDERGFYNLDDAMSACIRMVDRDVAQSSSWVVYKVGVVLQTFLQACWRSFLCFPIISAIVVMFCVSNPSPEKIRWTREHPNWTFVICTFAFITSLLVLYMGIEKFLFFIPENWGEFNDDGEWDGYRSIAAFILSFLGTGAITKLVENLYKAESTKLTQNNKS